MTHDEVSRVDVRGYCGVQQRQGAVLTRLGEPHQHAQPAAVVWRFVAARPGTAVVYTTLLMPFSARLSCTSAHMLTGACLPWVSLAANLTWAARTVV